jgi:hypothetical protein
MKALWTVRDSNGQLLPQFTCTSRLDVARRVLPGRYDPFRLHVSPSYREIFDRAVTQALQRQGWEIVRAKPSSFPTWEPRHVLAAR